MDNQQLKTLIKQIIPCEYIEAEGDGHHFFVTIISAKFAGLSRLQRHRLIKEGLKEHISSNKLHALSISVAATPEEWGKSNL